MIITHYQRGDSFIFTAAPVDTDSNPVTPDSVTLFINFLGANGRENVFVDTGEPGIEMTETTDGTYSAAWTSRGIGAKPGQVFWSVQTVNPDSSEQDSFMLDANLANPDT